MKVNSARRRATTVRGEDVIGRVVGAAVGLLTEHWLDDISIAKLAREAGVVRASLLLQFPKGWPDVANTIAVQELGEHFEDRAADIIEEKRKRPVAERLFDMLVTLIDRSEETGLLYPNIRGQMFVWGEENEAIFQVGLREWLYCIGLVSKAKLPLDEADAAYLAESLFEGALDLASRSGLNARTFRQRRRALRCYIEATVG